MIKNLFKNFLIILLFTTGLGGKAFSADVNFFTIGTGGTAYTYYPVGGMIANAISKPPGSRECGKGGSCGVDGLIASAVSSRGLVDNVNAILSWLRNSGFAQSDVAYWAYTGTGTMEGKEPAKDLRTIAALFEEHIHLVTLKNSKIKLWKDNGEKYECIKKYISPVEVSLIESIKLLDNNLLAFLLYDNKIILWKNFKYVQNLIDNSDSKSLCNICKFLSNKYI